MSAEVCDSWSKMYVVTTILAVLILSVVICDHYFTMQRKERRERFEKYNAVLNERHANADDIVTIFAQGVGSPFHQVSKYVGHDGISLWKMTEPDLFDKKTHSKRRSNEDPRPTRIYYSPLLLYNVHVPSKDLDDIECSDVSKSWMETYLTNPIRMIFVLKRLVSDFYFQVENGVPSNQRPFEMNVAGRQDKQNYLDRVVEALESNRNNDKGIVLFGTSRGASLTFLGATLMAEKTLSRIKLIILEAPFDDLHLTLKETYPPMMGECLETLLSNFAKYDKNQRSPIDAANKFPLRVPVAFIMTRNDTKVPARRTKVLIEAVKDARKSAGMVDLMVHELVLEENGHSEMSVGPNTKDVLAYKKFVDHLYSLYL
jgi:hypothetical protein